MRPDKQRLSTRSFDAYRRQVPYQGLAADFVLGRTEFVSCSTASTLPRLMTAKRGSKFSIAIDWCEYLAEGESINQATTTTDRAPEDSAEILGTTTIDGTTTIIGFDVAADQPYGTYHMTHLVVSSGGQRWVECVNMLVEAC